MKRLPAKPRRVTRFDVAARKVEDRFGHWPWWLKFIAGAPILIVLTAIVLLLVFGLGSGLVMLVGR